MSRGHNISIRLTRLESIDQDHRVMLDFADALTKVNPESAACDVTLAMLNRFERLCRLHFIKEEQLMREMEYPFLADHKQLHMLFLANLERFRNGQRQQGGVIEKHSPFSHIREDLVMHMKNEKTLLEQHLITGTFLRTE